MTSAACRPLRFHWRLLEGGEAAAAATGARRFDASKGLPDLDAQARFCRDAEAAGIDALLVDVGTAKPDPTVLAAALADRTETIRFMVACRPGLTAPAQFVQQINTLAAVSGGRVRLNVVSGHSGRELAAYGEPLDHDARYARMDEFLAVCRAFWQGGGPVDHAGAYYTVHDGRLATPFVSPEGPAPELFVGGNSAACRAVAARRGDCWVRFPLPLDRLAEEIRPVLDAGKQVALRMAVLARPTRAEATAAARAVIAAEGGAHRDDLRAFVAASDSQSVRSAYALAEQEWLSPCLWTGAVAALGVTCVCLLGSYDEVATHLVELGGLGVSQFILSGWPKWEEMVRFGREVIPRVRDLERAAASGAARGVGAIAACGTAP
jgi:alkanesulfonate monooxygenase